MPELFVILKAPLVGPDVNLVAGDQYPVQSQEQGDLMVSRELASWPEPEKPAKKQTSKPADIVVEQQTAETSTVDNATTSTPELSV